MKGRALVVALLVAAATAACGVARSGPASVPEPTGAAPATPVSTLSPGPTAAPSPTATSTAPALTIADVSAAAVTLRGDLAFVSRTVGDAEGFGATEIWAVPLDGGAPQRALRYPRLWTYETFVQRQLSADGRRFAFWAVSPTGAQRIVIADLASGALAWLATDASGVHDVQPVWSPDGRSIAFARIEGTLTGSRRLGLWVVGADGSGVRRLIEGGGTPTHIYGWTPDRRQVAYAQNVGYHFVDVASGATSSMANIVSGTGSWRSGSPSFVGAAWNDANDSLIVTSDGPDRPVREVVRIRAGSETAVSPRWRPARDEFLYLRIRPAVGPEPPKEIVRLAVDGSVLGRIATAVTFTSVEWSPDGARVVYRHQLLAPTPGGTGPAGPVPPGVRTAGATLRVVGVDGTMDREVLRIDDGGEPAEIAWDFAVRSYR